jgi:hypothetical protein
MGSGESRRVMLILDFGLRQTVRLFGEPVSLRPNFSQSMVPEQLRRIVMMFVYSL